MSGYGALTRPREDSVAAHIPVLALSANVIPRDIEKGLEARLLIVGDQEANVMLPAVLEKWWQNASCARGAPA